MSETVIRPATPDDQDSCGRILFEAFDDIARRHGFPPDFPSIELATGLMGHILRTSWGVVAERDGAIVGSNFLKEGDPVAALGPISVDPALHERGVGRRLMEAALERGERHYAVRLVQDAFNATSMALYASLGFEVREPLVCIGGTPRVEPSRGADVRPMEETDLEACAALCEKVHGITRSEDLLSVLGRLQPFVALRGGRVVAYASTFQFWPAAHAVAETEDDLHALIAGAAAHTDQPVSFLLPTRSAGLFRWALAAGLRIVKPMTLMTTGPYQEPRGHFLPSVGY